MSQQNSSSNSEKSHVGMGTYVCPVCTKAHTTVVLLDKRLRSTLTNDMHMGMELCPEHQKLKDDNFIALVGIDETKSDVPPTAAGAWRTGVIAHIKKYVFRDVFNTEVPKNKFGLALCDNEVIAQLNTMVEKS